jgi:hypothetical protein
MKFNRQGGFAMTLVIFIGGMFLGFILGLVTMALFAVKGGRFESEEAEEMEGSFVCVYPHSSNFSPPLEARPQAYGTCFIPGP